MITTGQEKDPFRQIAQGNILERLPLQVIAFGWLGACTCAWAAGGLECSVSTTSVAFGIYSTQTTSPLISNGNVRVSCSANDNNNQRVNYSIALGGGGNSIGNRRMTNGSSSLSYQIYQDAGYATVWGDQTGGALLASSLVVPAATGSANTTASQNHAAFGRIPALQNVRVGNYNNSLTVTVNY